MFSYGSNKISTATNNKKQNRMMNPQSADSAHLSISDVKGGLISEHFSQAGPRAPPYLLESLSMLSFRHIIIAVY